MKPQWARQVTWALARARQRPVGRSAAAWTAAAILLTGCANSNLADIVNKPMAAVSDMLAVQVPFLVPPRSSDAGALRSIALAAGPQPMSREIANSVESAMLKLRIREEPYYAAVKQDGQRPQPPNEAALLALARVAGTQGALGVGIAGLDTSQANSTEDRTECTAKDVKLLKACPKNQTVTRKVACTTVTSTATAQVRVVRASDNRTVLSDTFIGSQQAKSCAGEQAIDRAQLAGGAYADLVDRIMRTVAPSVQMKPLDLKSADSRLPESMKAQFEAAQSFAKGRRMDEACPRFQELYDNFKESVALTYNVAFCLEIRGDLLRASQTYRRASELNNATDFQLDRRLQAVELALKDNAIAIGPEVMAGATSARGAEGGAALDGRRVALVVGNARYERSALVNPVNDARLMSDRLKKSGFDVVLLENVDGARFATALRDYESRARGAAVALFYYAGHAIQDNGENLMMPVDNAKMRSVEDVRENGGVSLGSVIAKMDVAKPRVKLYILDACRDSPLPADKRSLGGGGLAAMKQAPEGSLIAFSTAPGRTAEDGASKNSVFTRHLVSALGQPNLTVEQVFKRVREAVKKETRNRQEPSEISSLVGDVVLTGT